MATKLGSIVHPWYRGDHERKVNEMATLEEPIRYHDAHQGEVGHDPRILLLQSEKLDKVLWFTYWLSTDESEGKMKWGQGSPMLEEDSLLNLLKRAIEKGFFSDEFLAALYRELGKALKRE
jgi:hypothetical protein